MSLGPEAMARATALLFRQPDTAIAAADVSASKSAQYANTERLRSLRLAREAALATDGAAPAPHRPRK